MNLNMKIFYIINYIKKIIYIYITEKSKLTYKCQITKRIFQLMKLKLF